MLKRLWNWLRKAREERAEARSEQRMVVWRFCYRNAQTRECKIGTVRVEKGRKPDSAIAAIYGPIMDWNEGVTNLTAKPDNETSSPTAADGNGGAQKR